VNDPQFTFAVMSTVTDIEAAIKSLPEPERQRLESWFIAQRSIDDATLERELTIAIEEAHSSPEERRLPAIRRRRMIGNVLPY